MLITLFFRSNNVNDCFLQTFNSYFFKINKNKIYETTEAFKRGQTSANKTSCPAEVHCNIGLLKNFIIKNEFGTNQHFERVNLVQRFYFL